MSLVHCRGCGEVPQFTDQFSGYCDECNEANYRHDTNRIDEGEICENCEESVRIVGDLEVVKINNIEIRMCGECISEKNHV